MSTELTLDQMFVREIFLRLLNILTRIDFMRRLPWGRFCTVPAVLKASGLGNFISLLHDKPIFRKLYTSYKLLNKLIQALKQTLWLLENNRVGV